MAMPRIELKLASQPKVLNNGNGEPINQNWIFNRCGRSTSTHYRGCPIDKPVEPKYTPKYDMLYAHTRECVIRPKG
jgi:hypothetical protein